jgi:hypothetical protein
MGNAPNVPAQPQHAGRHHIGLHSTKDSARAKFEP